jgi:hypothetical protein
MPCIPAAALYIDKHRPCSLKAQIDPNVWIRRFKQGFFGRKNEGTDKSHQ